MDTKVINALLGVSKKQPAKVRGIKLSSEEEVIAEKYCKMLKMGVPLDGVKQKMDLEDVDFKIVSVLVHESSQSSAIGDVESVSANPPKKSTKGAGPTLSKEEEAIATTYRNMLKVCIPEEAVRHKMKQEGVSDKIVDAVLGKEADVDKGSDHASLANANSTKTIAFHWTTSNLAPESLEQSIFGRTELKKRKLVSINPEELDIKISRNSFRSGKTTQRRKKLLVKRKTAVTWPSYWTSHVLTISPSASRHSTISPSDRWPRRYMMSTPTAKSSTNGCNSFQTSSSRQPRKFRQSRSTKAKTMNSFPPNYSFVN